MGHFLTTTRSLLLFSLCSAGLFCRGALALSLGNKKDPVPGRKKDSSSRGTGVAFQKILPGKKQKLFRKNSDVDSDAVTGSAPESRSLLEEKEHCSGGGESSPDPTPKPAPSAGAQGGAALESQAVNKGDADGKNGAAAPTTAAPLSGPGAVPVPPEE
ncbi:unnamed protein product [Amoebophrya sp. A120]|nr:unnamed protein product [Amoebophrya sp. A120]|eukprot:GSA120T00004565001.1